MRMKDDYMKNGQLKADYNLQIPTEGQYTLACDVFPNPTDMQTFIPFLNAMEKGFFSLPSYIVADAGYGSEQNYEDIHSKRFHTAYYIQHVPQNKNEMRFALMEVNLKKYTAGAQDKSRYH